jgi:UDP-N-acetylglucosamine 2-epimerase (non-hydrolysing)
MERPEALEVGSIAMTGLEFDEMQRAINREALRVLPREIPAEYSVENFSERVLNFVESTASRSAFWTGFRG